MIETSISYSKNEGLILNPTELRQLYFHGIRVKDNYGAELPDSSWELYIKAAQEEIEKYLGIKLFKQIIEEDLNYYRDEFESFGFIRTTYPVSKPYSLNGFIGTIKQIEYPDEWLSNRLTSDGYTYNRQMYIVPNFGTAKTGSIVYNGIIPYLGILGYNQIPNYWRVAYITGYDKIPQDLLNVIGMYASIGPLLIQGDLILGPGLNNQSLSIDGLSQSVNSKGFDSRIKTYLDQIKTTLLRLRTNYKGIAISAM